MEQDEFLVQLRSDFLTEAEELTAEAESAISSLEGSFDCKVELDCIFRVIHTLKGSAMTVCFDSLGAFCHDFENMLSDLRADKIKLTQSVIKILFRLNDNVARAVEILQRNPEDGHLEFLDVTEQLSKLDQERVVFVQPKAEVSEIVNIPIAPSAPVVNSAPKKNNSFDINSQNADDVYRVLIVDDEESICDIYQFYLEEFDTRTATSGEQALKILQAGFEPHVVVTDFSMPNMNGKELADRLKELLPLVPVVVCSGYSDRNHIVEFLNAGIFGFLEKPTESSALRSMVVNGYQAFQTKKILKSISYINSRAFLKMIKLTADILTNHGTKYGPVVQEIEQDLNQVGALTRKLVRS